jgi:hypothetical protein
MKFSATLFSALLALPLFLLASPDAQAEDAENFEKAVRSEPAHFHLQIGEHLKAASRLRLPSNRVLMNSHGGPVLHGGKAKAIFWGPDWSNATFAKDKIQGIDLLFSGLNGSRYAGTADEYYDSVGFLNNQLIYLGHAFDASAPPKGALSTQQAVAEACKLTGNNPDPKALYLLYTSTTAGNVNYCAWHAAGNCANGAPLQVAYMPNIDGVAGCDPGDAVSGHSQGLAALANVSAHELMETITDPRINAWYDASGNEIGDKCAWSFPAGNGLSVLGNGSSFMLQMEWSNQAYTAGSGQPNLSGQRGCIY